MTERSTPPPADVVPMLAYEDGVRALDWLVTAFGFEERARMIGPDGLLAHGELLAGAGLIMLATPTRDYESPRHHRERCAASRKWQEVPWVIDGVLVRVQNIDEHYRRAKAAGAVILGEIEDGFPGRRYRAEDLEGHRWMFLERAPAAG